MNKITSALIIAKPGHFRNSLQSLLRTITEIEILAESNDPAIMQKMHEDFRPELIVVDGGLMDETNWSAVKTIKADRPGTRVLVLTDNDLQGRAAKTSGADYYLLKGFPANELAQLIENSLIHETDDENTSADIE